MLTLRGRRIVIPLLSIAVAAGPALRAPAESPRDARVKPIPPAELRDKIDRTIDRGVAFLDSAQRKDGRFIGSYSGSHPAGETALAVLALCATGRGIEHRSVKDGIDALRALWEGKGKDRKDDRGRGAVTRRSRGSAGGANLSTYEVALSLMAVVEAYSTGGSVDPADLSSVARRKIRPLPGSVRDWIQDMANWIDEKKFRIGSREVAWRYPTGGYDHSCSQYAVLGLRAALQAGADVETETVVDALRHFLAAQEKSGDAVRRRADMDDGTGRYAARSYVTSLVDQARGWGYTAEQSSTPPMTAGGVSSLVICRDACRASRLAPADLAKRADQSVMDGLAWLGTRFEKEGRPENGNLYYLYGLERACVLAGVRSIGGRDWYVEGARAIVSLNAPDGCIGSLVDTCFAILFLTRATDPELARRERVVTPRPDASPDLEAAARGGDAELDATFERSFDAWRRGRLGVPAEPGARPVTDADMARLGPRGWRRLVAKLDADEPALRSDAFALLSRLAERTLGYHPAAPREIRLRGISEWTLFVDAAIADAAREAQVPGFESAGGKTTK